MGKPVESMKSPARTSDEQALRARILRSLREQGFTIRKGVVSTPSITDKDAIRGLHEIARSAAVERARRGLVTHERALIDCFADGDEVVPAEVTPKLVEVLPDSFEELLFRYAKLHWSIPVSAGYGRRLRFLIFDESNGKLIGLFGLGDPVFAIGPRDKWVGWGLDARRERLRHVMDAFVVGAVPPYSRLLCGKLVAMLLTSVEVQSAFRRKYAGTTSRISSRRFDGRLALVTTTSALGRSSVYNRVRVNGRLALESVGFTQGSGEFHFANGLYTDLLAYARDHLEPTAKDDRWGNGWRNRREVVRGTLSHLGLSPDMVYHGIKRELFVAPLASNTQEFLRGEHQRLRWHNNCAADIFEEFRDRWLLPRSRRINDYSAFKRSELRLWGDETR